MTRGHVVLFGTSAFVFGSGLLLISGFVCLAGKICVVAGLGAMFYGIYKCLEPSETISDETAEDHAARIIK
jgi:hypothetical protein